MNKHNSSNKRINKRTRKHFTYVERERHIYIYIYVHTYLFTELRIYIYMYIYIYKVIDRDVCSFLAHANITVIYISCVLVAMKL